jgi:hypothetical protein
MNGTAVIATSPDGHVQGCEVDFDQSAGAGLDLEQAQYQRARIRLSGRIISAHCSPRIAKALTVDPYMVDRVMENLRDAGWRFDARPVSTDPAQGGA